MTSRGRPSVPASSRPRQTTRPVAWTYTQTDAWIRPMDRLKWESVLRARGWPRGNPWARPGVGRSPAVALSQRGTAASGSRRAAERRGRIVRNEQGSCGTTQESRHRRETCSARPVLTAVETPTGSVSAQYDQGLYLPIRASRVTRPRRPAPDTAFVCFGPAAVRAVRAGPTVERSSPRRRFRNTTHCAATVGTRRVQDLDAPALECIHSSAARLWCCPPVPSRRRPPSKRPRRSGSEPRPAANQENR